MATTDGPENFFGPEHLNDVEDLLRRTRGEGVGFFWAWNDFELQKGEGDFGADKATLRSLEIMALPSTVFTKLRGRFLPRALREYVQSRQEYWNKYRLERINLFHYKIERGKFENYELKQRFAHPACVYLMFGSVEGVIIGNENLTQAIIDLAKNDAKSTRDFYAELVFKKVPGMLDKLYAKPLEVVDVLKSPHEAHLP